MYKSKSYWRTAESMHKWDSNEFKARSTRSPLQFSPCEIWKGKCKILKAKKCKIVNEVVDQTGSQIAERKQRLFLSIKWSIISIQSYNHTLWSVEINKSTLYVCVLCKALNEQNIAPIQVVFVNLATISVLYTLLILRTFAIALYDLPQIT